MRRLQDRYLVHELLGSGGMAHVHVGSLLGAVGVSRTVAIKRLHPHLAAELDFLAMFVDEARLATRIHHPNVVSTLEVVAAEGELFVIMEYVHGEALSRLLPLAEDDKRDRPAPAIVSAVVADTLHGLHAAHEARDERGEPLGIVHRDVSPHNILVGVDGSARIADFGVAKAAGRLHSTPGGEIKGKVGYLSPEHLANKPVTRATDVYATAVVLWQALTGRRLFPGANETEIIAAIVDGKIDPPSKWIGDERRSELGERTLRELDALTLRALARAPGDRFATAQEMAEALAASVPPAPRSQVGQWVERAAKESLDLRARLLAELDLESSRDRMSSKKVLEKLRSSPRMVDKDAPLSAKLGEGTESRASIVVVPDVKARGARRLLRVATISACLGTACLAVGWWSLKRFSAEDAVNGAPPVAAVDAGPLPRAMTDWPIPATASAEAADAYRAALQALRRGSDRDSRAELHRALTADPLLAAAQLRLALALRTMSGMETEQREHFKRALELRDRLSERDRGLLEAFEPTLTRDPAEPRESARLLAALSERFPDDAETAFHLGVTEFDLGDFAPAVETLRRAAALDPEFLSAWAQLAEVESYAGHPDEAIRSADRCLALSPIASDCGRLRCFVHRAAGDCVALAADARQMLASGGVASDQAYFAAEAVASQDADSTAIGTMVDQYALQSPPEEKVRLEWLRMRSAMFAGDFAGAIDIGKRLEKLNEANPSLSAHANTVRWLVAAELEAGATRDARDAAARFLARYPGWLPPPGVDDLGMHLDPLLWMLGVERRLGGVSQHELDTRRDAWVDGWRKKASGGYVPYIWLHGFAMSAVDREAAVDALSAADKFGPLPTFYSNVVGEAYVGRLYLEAGRPADAVPPLRRASKTCFALAEPIEHTEAILDLATAFEQTGQESDACAAYSRVIKRWGHARPRSASLETAKARAKALGCSNP